MSTTKTNVVSLLGKLDRLERRGTIVGDENVIISVLGNKRRTSLEVILKIEGTDTSEIKLQAVQIVQLIEMLDDYLDDMSGEES